MAVALVVRIWRSAPFWAAMSVCGGGPAIFGVVSVGDGEIWQKGGGR